jgi:hypothetical protein
VFIGGIVAWELLVGAVGLKAFILPKPSAILAALQENWGGGRFALWGSLVVEVVPDGEVLVEGDGRAHAAQVVGLQRYQSHLARHELPSKRPPSQEVTRNTGARRRRSYVR